MRVQESVQLHTLHMNDPILWCGSLKLANPGEELFIVCISEILLDPMETRNVQKTKALLVGIPLTWLGDQQSGWPVTTIKFNIAVYLNSNICVTAYKYSGLVFRQLSTSAVCVDVLAKQSKEVAALHSVTNKSTLFGCLGRDVTYTRACSSKSLLGNIQVC